MDEKPCPPEEESCPVREEGLSTAPKGKRTASFGLTGMTCATCAQTIQRSLEDLQGVESANVNLATERATVVYNPEKVDIDRNVLGKYSPEGLSFTRFDARSIMLYRFDGSLFTDGKGTPLNTKLSATDKEMIARMYPK